MPAEFSSPNPEINKQEAHKNEVNEAVQKIQANDVLNKENKLRENSAREIVESFNFGVDNVEDLLNVQTDNQKTEAQKRRSDEIYGELGEAVYLSMIQSGNPELSQAVVAGSESVEKLLPETLQHLGDAVVNNFTQNQELRGIIEYIDVIKNDPDLSDRDFMLSQIKIYSRKLDEVSIDPRNKRDLKAKAMVASYFGKMTHDLSPAVTPGHKRKERNNEASDDRVYPDMSEMTAEEPDNQDGGQSRERKRGFTYGPTVGTFGDQLMDGDRTTFSSAMPPEWYEKLDNIEKTKVRLMALINNLHTAKDNMAGEPDKLAMAYLRLNFTGNMFDVIYSDKHIRGAMEKFVRDLCDFKTSENGGLLMLKQPPSVVAEKVKNLFDYKETVAWKMKNPSLSDEEAAALVKEGKKVGGNETDSTEDKLIRAKVATAWSFIYYSNIMESADGSKDLTPGPAVADKIRTLINPLSKALGKFKVDKSGFTGEEEIFGGNLGPWIKANLSDPNFRQDLIEGRNNGNGIKPFPRRIAASFLDWYGVEAGGSKMSLGEALYKGLDVQKIGNDYNMFAKYKDLFEGASTAYSYIMGKVPLQYERNKQDWEVGLYNALSLIRQSKLPGDRHFDFVSKDLDNFMTYVIANSVGIYVGPKRLLLRYQEELYTSRVEHIVDTSNFSDILTKQQKDNIKNNLYSGTKNKFTRWAIRKEAMSSYKK